MAASGDEPVTYRARVGHLGQERAKGDPPQTSAGRHRAQCRRDAPAGVRLDPSGRSVVLGALDALCCEQVARPLDLALATAIQAHARARLREVVKLLGVDLGERLRAPAAPHEAHGARCGSPASFQPAKAVTRSGLRNSGRELN
jgi:hypothetical protein